MGKITPQTPVGDYLKLGTGILQGVTSGVDTVSGIIQRKKAREESARQFDEMLDFQKEQFKYKKEEEEKIRGRTRRIRNLMLGFK